jgi:hypothetical protein
MGTIVHSKAGHEIGVIVDQETERGGKVDVPGKPFNAHYTNRGNLHTGRGWKLGYFATHAEGERFIHNSHREHIEEREKALKDAADHYDRAKADVDNIHR